MPGPSHTSPSRPEQLVSARAGHGDGRRRVLATALALVVSAWIPVAASADTCRSWTRLSPPQKNRSIAERIDEAVHGPTFQQYSSLDKRRMQECLWDHAPTIYAVFDAQCVEGLRKDLQALNRTFRRYAWSCMG